MNFLGGYSSGSDSDAEDDGRAVKVGVPPKQATSTATATATLTAPKPHKKKTTTITLDLPDSLSDDDDTTNDTAPIQPKSKTGLFGFLPPPKASSKPVAESSTTSLVPQNLRKRLAAQSQSTQLPPQKKQLLDNPEPEIEKVPKDDDSDSFFTLDLPKPEKRAPLPLPSFKPAVSVVDEDLEPEPIPSYQHRPKALPVAPSSSSSAAYAYSESASSSYIYDPNAATDAQSYGSYYDQEDDSTRYAQVHLDDSALHRLGHRSGLGAVQVVDLNHEDQLGGEEARMRNIKNLSREKVEKSAYEHLKPKDMRLAKAKHSIMALAYEAKAREHELKEAFADRRQAKASSMNKYGF